MRAALWLGALLAALAIGGERAGASRNLSATRMALCTLSENRERRAAALELPQGYCRRSSPCRDRRAVAASRHGTGALEAPLFIVAFGLRACP